MQSSAQALEKILGIPYESLDERSKRVAFHVLQRKHIARDTTKDIKTKATRGQRAADAVAAFGGSWLFIGLFAVVIVLWVGLNSLILVKHDQAFDPSPYILLNLFMSLIAAIHSPDILMSQNRQAEKDRISAEHDYEVNLKAELEIMLLHEKMDLLREGQWTDLLAIQKEQIKLLSALMQTKAASP